MKRRVLNLLIALDQLAYVLLTMGAGHQDETLSAAAWRKNYPDEYRQGMPIFEWMAP